MDHTSKRIEALHKSLNYEDKSTINEENESLLDAQKSSLDAAKSIRRGHLSLQNSLNFKAQKLMRDTLAKERIIKGLNYK